MTKDQRNALWTALNLCEGISIKIDGEEGGRDLTEAEIMELLSGLEALGGTWSHSDAAKKAA